MRLAHLSLAVADQQRSRRFYETYFGFACDGELDSEGCLHLKDADGFDVTLARRLDVSPPLRSISASGSLIPTPCTDC